MTPWSSHVLRRAVASLTLLAFSLTTVCWAVPPGPSPDTLRVGTAAERPATEAGLEEALRGPLEEGLGGGRVVPVAEARARILKWFGAPMAARGPEAELISAIFHLPGGQREVVRFSKPYRDEVVRGHLDEMSHAASHNVLLRWAYGSEKLHAHLEVFPAPVVSVPDAMTTIRAGLANGSDTSVPVHPRWRGGPPLRFSALNGRPGNSTVRAVPQAFQQLEGESNRVALVPVNHHLEVYPAADAAAGAEERQELRVPGLVLPGGPKWRPVILTALMGIVIWSGVSTVDNARSRLAPSRAPAVAAPSPAAGPRTPAPLEIIAADGLVVVYESVEDVRAAHPEWAEAQATVLPYPLTAWYGTPAARQNPQAIPLITEAERALGPIRWQAWDPTRPLEPGSVLVGVGESEWPADLPKDVYYLDLSTPRSFQDVMQQMANQWLGHGSVGPYRLFPLVNGTVLLWYA